MPNILRLVSGGQTGADRAALDVAIRLGIPHGGWCPKGRRAEDGPLADQYQLTETPSEEYVQRTEWNVRDSDGTVVFTLSPEVTGGSLATVEYAKKHEKPCVHISRDKDVEPATLLNRFVRDHGIRTLNVAGSRESKEPGLHSWVTEVLNRFLAGNSRQDSLKKALARGYPDEHQAKPTVAGEGQS